jgi:hypothetical protein
MSTDFICEDPQYRMCVDCTHTPCPVRVTTDPDPLPTHWLRDTPPHTPLIIDDEGERQAFMDGPAD